jgi:D-glycero-alpha-D-manno-heptose-7-phosphate kinase
MILARAPLRISFLGGGSDLPEFYSSSQGAVISTTIDKYMYLAVNKTPNRGVKVSYERVEQVDIISELNHDRARNTLQYFDIQTGIEISSFCEIPTKGTGLGSSSTYTVALCKALDHATGGSDTRFELAESAFNIERVMCGDTLGKQDQYAASFGGFNLIEFNKTESVNVTPINITSSTLKELRDNLIMVYTGVKRTANDILSKHAEGMKTDEKWKTQHRMVEYAYLGQSMLVKNELDDFGKLLDESWKLKRSLADNISNESINNIYEEAIKAGALGGKILGAGGGGFLLFYVKPKYRNRVISKLSNFELFDNFNFSDRGAEVVYYDNTTKF